MAKKTTTKSEKPANLSKPSDKMKLLVRWQRCLEELAEVAKKVEAERRARVAAFEAFFPEPNEGVNNVELAGGCTLKATYSLTRKLDEDVLPDMWAKLADMVGPDGARAVIVPKPSLSVSAYKELTAEAQAVVNEALTVTPATPKLEIVRPKVGKERH